MKVFIATATDHRLTCEMQTTIVGVETTYIKARKLCTNLWSQLEFARVDDGTGPMTWYAYVEHRANYMTFNIHEVEL